MSNEAERPRRRRGFTRLSRRHQVTIPVAVLAEAGVQVGESLRVEALGPGRVILTRADDRLEDLLGALSSDVYPDGYLQKLRAEWESPQEPYQLVPHESSLRPRLDDTSFNRLADEFDDEATNAKIRPRHSS